MQPTQLRGDAAALYQAILRRGGEVSAFFCGRELNWDRRRIAHSIQELTAAGILRPSAAVLPRPMEQRRAYSLPEIRARMDADPAFARSVRIVEQVVGRRLMTRDLSALTELYDFHGMSPQAIELLAAQCCDEAALRWERRPSLKRIEKVGLDWAHMGVRTREDAVAAVQRMGLREEAVREVRRRMRQPDGVWIAQDEAYITCWLDWGFSPEVIEMAYDRTVLRCGRLNWNYCQGILDSWRKKKLFSPEEIEAGDDAERGGELQYL